MSLRDKILAASDIASEVVEVPEWGVTIEVRGMSASDRARMLDRAVRDDGKVRVADMYPALLIAACHDPESGERVFDESDWDAISAKSGLAVERIAGIAMSLSGMTPQAVDALGGDSSDSPNDD